MAPQITHLSDQQIDLRRQELLNEAAMTFDELSERARAYLLDPAQDALFRELQDLDYLQAKTA